jgi:hypothetical protein
MKLKTMNKINYLEIFKNAWKITWNNKYLWWFGLFVGTGGMGLNFNFGTGGGNSSQVISNEAGLKISEFVSSNLAIIVSIAIITLILFLVLLVLGILSYAGLLKSVNASLKNEVIGFRQGLKIGKKYFWKLILVGLLVGFTILGIVTVLSMPVIFLFYLKSYILAVLTLIVAIIIFIPVIILISFIGRYSRFYLILSDLNIKSSLENGYQLFRKNIAASIIMGLLFIPAGIIAGIALIIAILTISLAFVVLGLILYLILSKLGIIITAALGLLALIPILCLFRGVYSTFYHTSWFLFFREIATTKSEERTEEIAEVIKEKIPEASI